MVASVGERQQVEARVVDDDPVGAEQLVVCVGLTAAQCVDIARALNGATVVVAADAACAAGLLSQLGGALPAEPAPAASDLDLGPDRDPAPATVAPVPDAALPAPRRFIRHGALSLDVDGREARWNGRVLRLPGRELDLLVVLATDPGRASSFADLTERLWRRPYLGDPAAVISVVKRLRAHLRSDDVPLLVESVRGWGYRLTGWSGVTELDR